MMNQQPPHDNHESKQESNDSLRAMLLQMVKGLTKNWGMKLIALLIAVVLWAGLIAQDPDLTREKVFEGVTIGIAGEDTMKRNGFIVVSELNDQLVDATLRCEVPQLQYDTVTYAPFNARIDLSRVKATGKQSINVTTTNTSIYGSVKEVEPSKIEIMVEEYVTRYRIPVSVKMEGEVPEGFYATTPSVDPPMIAISGPKSLVEKIVRAEAVLDLTTLPAQEGNVRTAVRISLQNSDGEPVESRLVEMTSESVLLDSVVLEQTIYSQRTIPVSELALTTGTPARGYEVKQVTVTPSTIVAAGKAENLDVLDALYPSSSVSVNDAVQSFTQRVAVRKPSELAYLSADSITVAVEIAPIITEKAYERQKVTVANLPDGFKATMVTNRANVTVAGSMLWVEGLRSADLTLTVDASGLPAGSYELPVLCAIKDSEGQTYTVSMEPAFIQVDIVEK